MKQIKILFVLFLCVTFLCGLYFTVYYDQIPLIKKTLEGMEEKDKKEEESKDADDSCPDLLVQKGNVLMLYNTKQPIEEGKNPIPFFNLDEYINYLDIQRKRGLRCPVLFLQQENNAQGQDVYRMRPTPFDLQGGLPPIIHEDRDAKKIVDASRENPPYNSGSYAGFDPTGQYVGIYTDVDKVHDSTSANKISDNPMDPNWAGVTYTQQMVDSGKYIDNNVSRPILFNPKVAFYPTIPSAAPGPKDIL